MKLLPRILLVTSVMGALGCAKESPKSNSLQLEQQDVVGLRPLTSEERSTDFERIAQAVLDYYGPRVYKEKRFGYKVGDLIAEYRQKVSSATTDAEAFAVSKEFLTRFQDGHVSLTSFIGDGSFLAGYSVPLGLTPVDGHALIASIEDAKITTDLGIEIGDEVISIDGVSPFEILKTIRKYETIGNEVSDQHLINFALNRRRYHLELKPVKPTVQLTIEKANGTRIERTLLWSVDKERSTFESERKFPGVSALTFAYAPYAAALRNDRDPEVPFFINDQVARDFNLTRVAPSPASLKAHGLPAGEPVPTLFAALISNGSKRALLIRQSTYGVWDADARIAWYKAILAEYGPYVDALVIDQTRNPGGMMMYAIDFVSLFAHQQTRGLVNFFHPDRRWLQTFGSVAGMAKREAKQGNEWTNVAELAYKLVEDAYDRRLDLTEKPVPLFGYEYIKPQGPGFKKPILMLVDEMSGSCGDLVPLLMKENKLARIFGERTMGLGGNVEQVVQLANFSATLSLTRGLFTTFSPDGQYDLSRVTENNGVTPDVHYRHSVQDVRAGYTNYVKAFLEAAFAANP